jgi:hypothetical protein
MNKAIKKAIKLNKRIQIYEKSRQKFRGYAKKVSEWIKRDKKELKSILSKVDDNELLIYGEKLGYLK